MVLGVRVTEAMVEGVIMVLGVRVTGGMGSKFGPYKWQDYLNEGQGHPEGILM
jgi:hypothetical protein